MSPKDKGGHGSKGKDPSLEAVAERLRQAEAERQRAHELANRENAAREALAKDRARREGGR